VSCQGLRRQIVDGLMLQPEVVAAAETKPAKVLKGIIATLLGKEMAADLSSDRAHKRPM
jgi:type II secretory pathway component PulC